MRKLLVLLAILLCAGLLSGDSAHASVRSVRTGSNQLALIDSLTGAQGSIERVYFPGSEMPSVLRGQAKAVLDAGDIAVISLNPRVPVEQSQLTAFAAWCKSIVADGYRKQVRLTVWHEANLHLSLSDWLSTYAAYEKIAHDSGIKFGVIFDTYDFNHGMSLAAWMPPASTVSFLAVDLYPRNHPGHPFESPLYQLRYDIAWTAQYRKPLDIAEVGIEPVRYGTAKENRQASQYLLELEGLPARTYWVMWFQGSGISMAAHNDALAPAWRELADWFANR